MTDLTHPSGGGAYVRLPDGTLQLEEAPTARDAETPVEAPLQTALEEPAKARRSPAPANTLKEA